jgi:hypothetical protein
MASLRTVLEKRPSTTLTHWLLPLGAVWSGFMVSAFAYGRSPPGQPIDMLGVVTLLGAPMLSLVGFAGFRASTKRISPTAYLAEDAIVTLVLLFLLAVHALLVAGSFRMITTLHSALPIATAALLISLGPALSALPHGSAMGIRTRATLASPDAWTRTHRFVAVVFPVAGIASMGSMWLRGLWMPAGAVIPALAALSASVFYGLVVKPNEGVPTGSP